MIYLFVAHVSHMKDGLLTDRQKEVLRYRKNGMTQQQIADIINTSKANVCTVEKSAWENIKRAPETLDFLYSLDAKHLCVIERGSDLLDAVRVIYDAAEKEGIKVQYDSIELMNKIRSQIHENSKSRLIRQPIEVYLKEDGDLYLE